MVKERKADEAAARPKHPRPAFAADYPKSAELDALLAAFAAGDYRLVRRKATELAEGAEDEAVRRAAQDLRRRLDPDRITLFLFLLALGLLVVLVAHYLLGGH